MYKPGQHVRIIHDSYPESGSRSFIGQTGTVTGIGPTNISVTGVNPDRPEQPYGFYPEEIEPA